MLKFILNWLVNVKNSSINWKHKPKRLWGLFMYEKNLEAKVQRIIFVKLYWHFSSFFNSIVSQHKRWRYLEQTEKKSWNFQRSSKSSRICAVTLASKYISLDSHHDRHHAMPAQNFNHRVGIFWLVQWKKFLLRRHCVWLSEIHID